MLQLWLYLCLLFVKGFLWFGSFGAIFTSGVNAVCGVYSLKELLVLLIVSPVSAVSFYFIFNKPHNKETLKFPKIYFSKTRQESWGALLGVILPLVILALLKGNKLTSVFTLCCALFGGIGWVLGQLMQIYSIHYAETSTSSLGRYLSKKNNVDSWKVMECVLGAFGGIGAVVGFIFTYSDFKNITYALEKNGGLISVNNTFTNIAFAMWLVMLALDIFHYFLKKPITKKELKKKLKNGEISRADYSVALIKAVDTVPKFYNIYLKATEIAEPVLYGAIPFVLISLGCDLAALSTSFFIVLFVICQEITLEKVITPKSTLIARILTGIVCIVVLVLQLTTPVFYNYKWHLILYTIIYECLTLGWLIPQIIMEYKKSHPAENINSVDVIRKNKKILKITPKDENIAVPP